MALIRQGQGRGRKSQSGSLQTLADIEALPHHIKAFSLFVYSYNAFNQNNEMLVRIVSKKYLQPVPVRRSLQTPIDKELEMT